MQHAEEPEVDAAALARIEGKIDTGMAEIKGKIDTSMAGVNARVDALDGRLTRVEQAHEQLRSTSARKPLSGLAIAGLVVSAMGVLAAIMFGAVNLLLAMLPHLQA